MSLPKLRNLDKYGVITDVDPFDLPLGAWSMALNVRFEDGRVTSAPVWRAVGNALTNTKPRFVYVANKADTTTSVYVGSLDGSVTDWTPSSETAVNVTGFTPNEAEAQWSGATLANVVYLNREDRIPWLMRPADTKFSNLTGWDPSWRAKLIRSYASALVAFNITKTGVRYPTLVKTSDLVIEAGFEPPSWDATDPTTNATENPLTEMNGEIVEAQQLGNSMIIYSNSEAWQMTADGSDNVYAYRPLPFSKGAIGTNCVVEVDNQHYVFGSDDIWRHDGLSSESIADGRVRKFIYNSMNAKQSDRFFASYNPSKKTISFHYVSGDAFVSFNGNGCNRAAVYHLTSKTWTFDDVPLAFASGYAKVSLNTQTWASVTSTWATAGGSWQDLEDGFKRTMIYVGENASGLTARVYARDNYGNGSNLSASVDTVATRPGLLLRDGIDMDELDAELRGYKVLLAIWPQGRLDSGAAPLSFSVGVTDYPNVAPFFDAPQTYDALENYKLDFTASGRFLSLRIDYPDYKTMSLSGFDFELDSTGSR
ncbi:hypothetical protein JQ617_07960 [Bradyrhizobium sp. KB893862 SZCCT0404]|uniref:hypothetical protein n=1 Tax=Bradyrhizobium sp. KB893862 SZCCT0404 TaxID=2807672 RepID=UPI001BA9FF09|nr:hypothetical protein [Bradyrhizobium sp. KB893862 SZCCT0404]MBR1173885.1 hypothetical protein [Bradyrhizobium sp. KB893862 SZCCT0404]